VTRTNLRSIVTDGAAWFVGLSVAIVTDEDAIWAMNSGGPSEGCVRWGCTLAQPGEYD